MESITGMVSDFVLQDDELLKTKNNFFLFEKKQFSISKSTLRKRVMTS